MRSTGNRGLLKAVAPVLVLGAVGLSGGVAGSSRSALAAGVPIAYAAGWNLVGGPDGTVFGASGNIYTLSFGDSGYETSRGDAPANGGAGYWAFFPAATSVSLNGAGKSSFTTQLLAGQYAMVGDPSGTQAVTISGADQALTYDPVSSSYTATTVLSVGQGAWVMSSSGGQLTLTATGTALALPTAARPTVPSQPSGAVTAPGASSNSGSVAANQPITVSFLGLIDLMTQTSTGVKAYSFGITGFKTSDFTPTQLSHAVNITGPDGMNVIFAGVSVDAFPNSFAILMYNPAPGAYTIYIALPDGRATQTTFTL